MNSLNDMLQFHQQALNVRGYRQQLLASNMANADTPNFKARDVDFNSALQGALARTSDTPETRNAGVLATTAPQHLSVVAGREVTPAGAALLYRSQMQGSVDGNTVDMDTERAQFADNAIHYETNLTLLNHQIKTMMAAIQG
ncbi:MAG: flagellar basal body rod protein FlgB [Thiobacillaceae bacterium]